MLGTGGHAAAEHSADGACTIEPVGARGSIRRTDCASSASARPSDGGANTGARRDLEAGRAFDFSGRRHAPRAGRGVDARGVTGARGAASRATGAARTTRAASSRVPRSHGG
jgi:hypothetical protein